MIDTEKERKKEIEEKEENEPGRTIDTEKERKRDKERERVRE